MKTQGTNLFIVDDNKLMLIALKQFIQKRFGNSLHISTFINGDSCLEMVNKETHIVILDYFMDGQNGLEVLKQIKAKNPKTEVIMLSGNENKSITIETFRAGAKDYIVKERGAWDKVIILVESIITAPIKLMGKEFSISTKLIILLIEFAIIGVVVFSVLHLIK
jgi:two-component system response regulator HydG